MEGSLFCTLVAMDPTSICYMICATCEKPLSDNSTCKYCNFKSSKRLFRILLSVATETKVVVVICFDRAAQILFGCSADEFFDFAKLNPFAAEKAAQILEGEMLKITLSKPKSGHAQHLRVASAIPLRCGFCPVIESLRKLYQAGSSGQIQQ